MQQDQSHFEQGDVYSFTVMTTEFRLGKNRMKSQPNKQTEVKTLSHLDQIHAKPNKGSEILTF